MKILNNILADLIRRGKVTVDIPGLEMDCLTEYLHSEAARTLLDIKGVACAEEMTNEEKINYIQDLLA